MQIHYMQVPPGESTRSIFRLGIPQALFTASSVRAFGCGRSAVHGIALGWASQILEVQNWVRQFEGQE